MTATLLDPPAGAVWWQLERDVGEAWEPVQLDGRTYFKIGDAPSPEQATLAAGPGTYRIEWRPKKQTGRRLGYSLSFTAAGGGAPLPVPADNDNAEPERDEDDDDERDEDDDDERDDDEAPAPTVPATTPKGAYKRRKGTVTTRQQPAAPIPRGPSIATLPQAQTVDPHMFSFQAFEYFKHSNREDLAAEREERQRAHEREMKRIESANAQQKEATMQLVAVIVGAQNQQAQMFERVIGLTREKAEVQTEVALAKVTPGGADMAVVVQQLNELRAAMAEREAGADDDDDDDEKFPFTMEDVATVGRVVADAFAFIGRSPWAAERFPELAKWAAASAPAAE